jgi:hypothetical protein
MSTSSIAFMHLYKDHMPYIYIPGFRSLFPKCPASLEGVWNRVDHDEISK